MTSTDGAATEDNSLVRLIGLSDAVFAISLTLLVLDLKVPDLGAHPTEAALGTALRAELPSFLSYLLSFYFVANYWLSHRELMKSVTGVHPRLVRHTLPLLLLVSVLPFPASLLGRYASEPLSLAIYGSVNVLAVATLLLLLHDVRSLGLTTAPADRRVWIAAEWSRWFDLGVFLLAIPAGFLFGGRGLWIFLLFLTHRSVTLWHFLRRR